MSPSAKPPRPVVGWREWVALPDLGIEAVKAKVDTGARTSSLHAFDVHEFERGGNLYVRFQIHPEQRSRTPVIDAVAPVHDRRVVRPSSGHEELRYVIRTPIRLFDATWPVELTLTRRDAMGFRMLLGRQAIRGRYAVDPGRSFVAGRRAKSPSSKKKKRPKR